MTPPTSNNQNEEDNNSFVSNVTNTAKALASMVIKGAFTINPVASLAASLSTITDNTTEETTPILQEKIKPAFKYSQPDFRPPQTNIAQQLNAFRTMEKQVNWKPIHKQYYASPSADEYMGLPGISKTEIKPQIRPQKLMDQTYLKLSTTPKARNQTAMDKLPSVVSSNTKTLTVADFENDTAFQEAFKRINKKHGVEKNELYALMFKESSFRPSVQNRKSEAVGLFQFLPGVLEDRHKERSSVFPDVSAFDVQTMAPAEQLDLYSKYLDSWNYTSDISLGMMQAAPSRRKRKGNAVVYTKKDNPAKYAQNPGWIDKKTGLITVDSINAYYAGLFSVAGKSDFMSKKDFPTRRPTK